jgi:transposase
VRGRPAESEQLFSYVRLEDRVPGNHPLRAIRSFVDPILRDLSPRFDAMYAGTGRPSIPPEQLIRALLLQMLYTIRSERMLCEQLDYNLLFRWFVDVSTDARIWDHSTFSKNRDRFLEGDIAQIFFVAVVGEAERRGWLSDEHFTVDGTLLKAWASHKSFRPKDGPPSGDGSSRNPDRDFRGERRRNDTHASTTDPDARLARRGLGKESQLAYLANVLMENRNGLIVDTEVVHVSGTAEREAALTMIDRLPHSSRRRTLAGDKGFDVSAFVDDLRVRNITPHIAQIDKRRRSAIDGRTTRHPGYARSQRKRKLVEQGFGWQKTTGGLGQLKHRGLGLVNSIFCFSAAAFNLVRMRTLLGGVSP